jgi:hypothetical protein
MALPSAELKCREQEISYGTPEITKDATESVTESGKP